MGTVNSVMIIGNLGQNPELKYTQSGRAVCNMSVATTHKPKEQPEQTEWHRVVTWDAVAENCSKYLTKGRSVCVQGRLATREWSDKAGNKQRSTEIIAEKVTFLGPGTAANNGKKAQPANDNRPDFGAGEGDDSFPE